MSTSLCRPGSLRQSKINHLPCQLWLGAVRSQLVGCPRQENAQQTDSRWNFHKPLAIQSVPLAVAVPCPPEPYIEQPGQRIHQHWATVFKCEWYIFQSQSRAMCSLDVRADSRCFSELLWQIWSDQEIGSFPLLFRWTCYKCSRGAGMLSMMLRQFQCCPYPSGNTIAKDKCFLLLIGSAWPRIQKSLPR